MTKKPAKPSMKDVLKAAAEITALWQWAYQRVGMSTRQSGEV